LISCGAKDEAKAFVNHLVAGGLDAVALKLLEFSFGQ
jgi:hypothetical protein